LERLLKVKEKQNEEAMYMEDTQKLVTEIEMLRSWVQIPPGPFFTVIELRHYFELKVKSITDVILFYG
jgi:hypothetical protein